MNVEQLHIAILLFQIFGMGLFFGAATMGIGMLVIARWTSDAKLAESPGGAE